MMRAVLAFAVVFLALSFDLRPAPAQGDAPWCAIIGMGEDAVYEDCRYRTFEECVPNVLAGNRGFCNPNPRSSGAAAKPHLRGKRHARKH